MTRIVARRTAKPREQCQKRPDAYSGLCGYCIGPLGAILPHKRCRGLVSERLICTCTVCYGSP